MATRGVPFHPDADQAFQMAKNRIRTYKGSQPVMDEPTRMLVQSIVMDALVVAPQPVSPGWVSTTLMTVGGLVRWAYLNSEVMDREHLLATQTRNRFLNIGCRGMQDTSVNNYRTRLDLVATALSATPVVSATTRRLVKSDAVEPHTETEVATLWVWANGLRPATRRDRAVASLVLALGCGLRARELTVVTREDVVIDSDGVHVSVVTERGTRSVTCDRAWEDRLIALVDAAVEGCPLTSPWRDTPTTGKMLQTTLAQAQHTYEPPVWFSVTSLRNTWMLRHLRRGTQIPVLLAAAGVESIEALKPYLAYIDTASATERADWLRGGTR